MAIDWDFICAEEGGQQLTGYVPMPEASQSGVTIATGVDVGQRTAEQIDALSIAPSLKERLKPYCELRRNDAVAALEGMPLKITTNEAAELDNAIRGEAETAIRNAYDLSTIDTRFDSLPAPAQTVIASVAFQYGVHLNRRTPRFWAAVTAQDWPAAVAELRDFGDRFATRRNREADLLAELL